MLKSETQIYKNKLYSQRRQKYIQSKLLQLRLSCQQQQPQLKKSQDNSCQYSSSLNQPAATIDRAHSTNNDQSQYCLRKKFVYDVQNTQSTQSTDISEPADRNKLTIQRIKQYVLEQIWSATQKQTPTTNCYKLYEQLSHLKKILKLQQQHCSDMDRIAEQITTYIIKIQQNVEYQQSQGQGQQQRQYLSEQQDKVQDHFTYFSVYLCFIICYCDVMGNFRLIRYRLCYVLSKIIEEGNQIFSQLAYTVLMDVYTRQPLILTQPISNSKDNNNLTEDSNYKKYTTLYIKQLLYQLPTKIQSYPYNLPIPLNTTNQIQYSQSAEFSCEYELLEYILINIHIEILEQYINTGGFDLLLQVDIKLVRICVKRLQETGTCVQLLQAVLCRYGSELENKYQWKQ